MFRIGSSTGRLVSAAMALAASVVVLTAQTAGDGTRAVVGDGPSAVDGGLQIESVGSPRLTRTITPQANPQAVQALRTW